MTIESENGVAQSGSFSQAQRDFIRKHDWDFISTYMSQQASWELQVCDIPYFELTQFTPDDPLLRSSLPALRLRFLLFYLRHLRDIVDRLLREISLQIEAVDVVFRGEIRGQINMTAYWQTRYRSAGTPTFPCRVTCVDYDTEENQLLVFTLLKMREQIRTIVPAEALGAPEEREIQYNLDYMSSVLHQAYFEQIVTDEEAFLKLDALSPTLGDFQPMLDRIRQRCERRVIPSVYAELVEWFQAYYLRQGAQPAQPIQNDPSTPVLQALYYGEGFDDTLYELWLLARIVKGIRDQYRFSICDPRPFYEVAATRLAARVSHAQPVCTLVSPSGRELRVFYRKGNGVLWGDTGLKLPACPYWADLRGIPDLTLVLGEEEGPFVRFILDAKNRHWGASRTPPSEEVYKMVGYLSNFRESNIRAGALIFRSDLDPRQYSYQAAGGAEVLATYSISPDENPAVCADQISQLCEVILDRLGLLALSHSLTLESQRARAAYLTAADSPTELVETALVERFLVPLYLYCDRLATQRAQEIERHIGMLRTEHLADFVDRMSAAGRQYLATAEMLFKEMDPQGDYDYAAAMICYTRCIEQEVNYQLLMPFKHEALAQQIDLSPSPNLSMPSREPTLGGIVIELKRCTEPTYTAKPVYAALRKWIKDHARDANYLLNRFPNLLDDFNSKYRHGAAHTSRVTFPMLQACRNLFWGIGSNDRLLFHFMYALKPWP